MMITHSILFESLIIFVKTTVRDKMVNELKEKRAKYMKKSMSVKELKCDLNHIRTLDDYRKQNEYFFSNQRQRTTIVI